MNTERIISLIESPNLINRKDITFLEDMSIKHPSFSISHVLLAKGLLNTESVRYNQKLKKAALYSLDRKQLFRLISQDVKKDKIVKENIPIEVIKVEEEVIITPKKELKIGKPLEFDETEEHSFSEWLSLTKVQKINREETEEETDLINNFIKKSPTIKIEKNKFFSATETAKSSIIENDELVTETLARVYLEQEYFEKAIESYKKLSLKYPKKSSFFADQINLITNLKKK
ncbi:MAG: hypothetical protein HN702_06700 [Flavobacteriales bacterium]|jgi:hypothetical protein|nr:hypothetical protein [Flavobacteriales bacterium]MBT4738316.1 hypothetical protein [Flavobacteriales bacterium]MBT5354134.1 hypothetical protein [Flavobacteriales bacterium]MBT6698932.1 hypothetical protein [Flavobacteriales bacterium]MBT7619664.1 hypothetical protein [Flavobacteriales bacterium]